jgi:hypothetical protein
MATIDIELDYDAREQFIAYHARADAPRGALNARPLEHAGGDHERLAGMPSLNAN